MASEFQLTDSPVSIELSSWSLSLSFAGNRQTANSTSCVLSIENYDPWYSAEAWNNFINCFEKRDSATYRKFSKSEVCSLIYYTCHGFSFFFPATCENAVPIAGNTLQWGIGDWMYLAWDILTLLLRNSEEEVSLEMNQFSADRINHFFIQQF